VISRMLSTMSSGTFHTLPPPAHWTGRAYADRSARNPWGSNLHNIATGSRSDKAARLSRRQARLNGDDQLGFAVPDCERVSYTGITRRSKPGHRCDRSTYRCGPLRSRPTRASVARSLKEQPA
jgi:hypothetical protein